MGGGCSISKDFLRTPITFSRKYLPGINPGSGIREFGEELRKNKQMPAFIFWVPPLSLLRHYPVINRQEGNQILPVASIRPPTTSPEIPARRH